MWSATDIFSVGIGCSKMKSGGWDFANYNEAQTIHLFNPANATVAGQAGNSTFAYVPGFKSFNPSIELGLHLIGEFTLQILNDSTPGLGGGTGWNKRVQQTWGLEWRGEFAGIHPIVQYGSYDDGHSSHFDLGLMMNVAGLGITVDYMMVSNSEKVTATGSTKPKSKTDNSNRFSFELSYMIKNMITPSLYYSYYMNKLNSKDPGANSAIGVWDHEGQVWGLAVAANNVHANFSPYIAIDSQGGRFIEGGKKKTKSDFVARIGATAKF